MEYKNKFKQFFIEKTENIAKIFCSNHKNKVFITKMSNHPTYFEYLLKNHECKNEK